MQGSQLVPIQRVKERSHFDLLLPYNHFNEGYIVQIFAETRWGFFCNGKYTEDEIEAEYI